AIAMTPAGMRASPAPAMPAGVAPAGVLGQAQTVRATVPAAPPESAGTAAVSAPSAVASVPQTGPGIAATRPTSGLFAQSAPGMAGGGAARTPGRNSIFNLVTGAIKGAQQAVAPVPVPEPARIEPARVSMLPTSGEEMGLEIPAFLRRQDP
ncbi:MAG: hypothetical protein ACP5NI_07290, partial [Acetobacteraceae bacterium]